MKKESNDELKGTVERVTFHNPETGFCVLRIQVRGQNNLLTVIGKAIQIAAGEFIECTGYWVNDKNYGLQFQAIQLNITPPSSRAGIEKYLSSGMIKGIGPYFAKKLLAAFGEAVFDVIESEPERLLTLEGIGKKRQQQVVDAWNTQKAVRAIIMFLQLHGVGTARALRIYKTYGDNAIARIKENPYQLSFDIRGIGFKTADIIAEKVGVDKHSLIRAQAGIHHTLQEFCSSGHCAAPYPELITASTQLLNIPTAILEQALDNELTAQRLIADTIDNERCIYPAALYYAELKAAQYIKKLNIGVPPWGNINFKQAISIAEIQTGLKLSHSQLSALQTVLTSKLAIITGGPGVGKTTILKILIQVIQGKKLCIELCAPTGRAAKRLTEITNLPAKTIHRLLDFSAKSLTFKHNQDNLLPLDVLIIDEASMLDIVLLHHLLKAIPQHAAVMFIGDIDQLPSVGAGAVLADLIASEVITTVRLTEIFRQSACSMIIINAHRINQGWMPLPNASKQSDFFTIYNDNVEDTYSCLMQVVAERVPRFYKCDPIKEIQVLTPMNRGGLGSRGLNIALQQQLNGKAQPKITRFGTTFAPGDKVIQTTNNYDKDVFNGDIGFIESIDEEAETITVKFEQDLKLYDMHELDELNLAYAVSIHKSQGSEFPIVVMPISTQHYVMLARNLLYTGITRGKKLVILIGQKKAVAIAVKNNKEARRIAKLAIRLNEGSK